ncbi:MAG: PilZ domain-containing protein [Acidimicrobiales bacterium]
MAWEFPNTMPESTSRAAARHEFAVPMIVELPTRLLRPAQRVDALLVDLSPGGAALLLSQDTRLKEGRRFRVTIDDHGGIVQVRNITHLTEGQIRIGVTLESLGLELQELVADTLDNARKRSSRLGRERDPFASATAAPLD